jgi:hypothetical protein
MHLTVDSGSGYVEVPGTKAVMYNRTRYEGENSASVAAVLDLNDGDKIKIQVKRDDGSSTLELLEDGSSLVIFSARGPKGETGDSGSGSAVNLKHQWTTVSGSPFSTLNFTGAAMRYIQDEGDGQAEVFIEPLFGAWYGWDQDEGQSSTNSTSWQNKATYTTPSPIPAGWYRVGYSFEWRRDDIWSDFKARVQIDNTTDVMEMSEGLNDANSWQNMAGFYIVQLGAGTHTIDLDYCGDDGYHTSFIRRARIEFWMITSA